MPAQTCAAHGTIGSMSIIQRLLPAQRRPAQRKAWLPARSRAEPDADLALVASGIESITTGGLSPEARMLALETMRAEMLTAAEPVISRLRDQPIPLALSETATFQSLVSVLTAGRDAFKRVHVDLCEPGVDSSQSANPVPRALLALAWALEMQSRLLTTAARLRVTMPRKEWDELCQLAYPLWQSQTFQVAFPDSSALGGDAEGMRTGSPAAGLALPLLMRLVEPLGLDNDELSMAHRLAWMVARRVGLRIELDGLPHVSSAGPCLMLSPNHTVQIDSSEALTVLLRCTDGLSKGLTPEAVGLRTLLSVERLTALLGRLRVVWGPCHVPTPLVKSPVPRASLRIGLPRLDSGSDTAPDTGPEIGEEVGWRGMDAYRSVFTRSANTPRLRLGCLVALQAWQQGVHADHRRASRPGAGPRQIMVGQVVSLAHTGWGDRHNPFAHDLGVRFWPGSPRMVQVRRPGGQGFEACWSFIGVGCGDPPSVVVRRDAFAPSRIMTLLDGTTEQRLRMIGLLERGVDFDRIAVAPAD
jgi:hypothetical protein